jgi:hypothetical protein
MEEQIKVLNEKADKMQATLYLLIDSIFRERLNKIKKLRYNIRVQPLSEVVNRQQQIQIHILIGNHSPSFNHYKS